MGQPEIGIVQVGIAEDTLSKKLPMSLTPSRWAATSFTPCKSARMRLIPTRWASASQTSDADAGPASRDRNGGHQQRCCCSPRPPHVAALRPPSRHDRAEAVASAGTFTGTSLVEGDLRRSVANTKPTTVRSATRASSNAGRYGLVRLPLRIGRTEQDQRLVGVDHLEDRASGRHQVAGALGPRAPLFTLRGGRRRRGSRHCARCAAGVA